MATRKYSDEEVRAIIDHALDSGTVRDVSHDELLSIAADVGLSPESIDRAARDLEERRATDAAKRVIIGRRRRVLAFHAGLFLLINLLLFGVNFLTSPGEWWVSFPIVFWGLALIAHASFALSRSVSERAIGREHKRRAATLPLQREQPKEQRVRLNVGDERTSDAEAGQTLDPSEPVPVRRTQER